MMANNERSNANDKETTFNPFYAKRPHAPSVEPEPLFKSSKTQEKRRPVSNHAFQSWQGRIEIAAAELLGLIARCKQNANSRNEALLLAEAVESVQEFENNIRIEFGFNDKMAKDASYLISATIDDLVGGSNSLFKNKGVCSSVHQDRKGWWGEMFFDLVKEFKTNTSVYLKHLELAYLCLSLGFQGKYRGKPIQRPGETNLEEERKQIWNVIKSHYGSNGFDERFNLDIHPGNRASIAASRLRLPLWVFYSLVLFILMMIWIAQALHNGRLSDELTPYLEKPEIGLPPRPQFSMPVKNNIDLTERLKEDIADGKLEVIHSPVGTIVRMPGSTLFSSGSAEIQTDYDSSLERIAAALQNENGMIKVDGFADANPIKSNRGPFKSNQELSQARAMRVAERLQKLIGDTNRTIQPIGHGASSFLPGDTKGSHQRRVEITIYSSGVRP